MLPKVTVPEGVQHDVEVVKFTIGREDAARALWSYGSRSPTAGEYTKLVMQGEVMMSDTKAEIRDHYEPVYAAKGNCLVAGLGLGVVVQGMLLKTEVTKVTVIEKSQDVIDLVADHYYNMFGRERLEIICADIFEWKAPKNVRYDVAWYDIWRDLCTDNLSEMTKLHRKFGRKTDWQGSWGKSLLVSLKRREKKEANYFHW